MPLYLTGSHSSKVRKPVSVASLRRSSSSPFANLARTKALQRAKSLAEVDGDDARSDGGKLDATGKLVSPSSRSSAKTVEDAIKECAEKMFCHIPERAGMNSTRITEVLNFRKALAPLVTYAGIHASMTASSRTEREIAALLASGKLRKIKLLGRGSDLSGLSELLITTADLEATMRSAGVSETVIHDFFEVLAQSPRATSVPVRLLHPSHMSALIRAGFLVSSSLVTSQSSLGGSSIIAPPTISRAASGSWAAVGGGAAFENLGGVGMPKRHNSESQVCNTGNELALSIPNVGPYLRLLYAARSHLMELLGKSKYREAPLYLLRERWDGAVESDSSTSTAKRARGEFAGLLPGKTKKWKDLYGLDFDWTLQECLGAGLVELFETKSVGHGVRAL